MRDATEPLLLRADADGVATLTLDRPEKRNALSRALMAELHGALDTIAADSSVRVVVLAAAGPVFCAGHDLKELRSLSEPTEFDALFEQCGALMLRLQSLPQPVIAKVQGMATAAGCQLVATCDLAVAVESASFATPGVSIGLFCSTPMVALTRAIPAKQAMEMMLTGEPVDAATAVRLGLINRAVPAELLDETVETLARSIARRSAHTIKIGKEAFYRQRPLSTADAYAYAGAVMARNMRSHDAEEGIDAFLQRRAPVWRDR